MEVIPRRIGGLRLQGNQGCMELWCIYLSHLRPAAQALTVIGGDWNFAADATDRGGSTR